MIQEVGVAHDSPSEIMTSILIKSALVCSFGTVQSIHPVGEVMIEVLKSNT